VWHDTNAHFNASWYYGPGARVEKPKGYNAALMTDLAIDFITANASRPWCLFLSLNPPHPSFTDAPAEQKALYDAAALKFRPNVPPFARRTAKLRADLRGYNAHITAVDAELGRLLRCLDSLGLAQKTLVVYTSDHGEMMGSQGRMGKRVPFEESCRVPFIARWPGVLPAGLLRDTLLTPVDIYPSLCGLAGLPVPAICRGRNLAPAFQGQKIDEPESTILMHIDKANITADEDHPAPVFRGVRTTRYTYAEHSGGPWLLFDNADDPYQEHNLVASPAHADLRSDLRGLLGQWLYRVGDRFELST
jgi:arylsulfatase A-like enzyme